jgi:hypothetical protein
MAALARHLTHICDIGTTTQNVDAAGAPTKTQATGATDVPCRLINMEGITQDLVDRPMGRALETEMTLLIGSDVAVEREDVISNIRKKRDKRVVIDDGSYRVVRKRDRLLDRVQRTSLTLRKIV